VRKEQSEQGFALKNHNRRIKDLEKFSGFFNLIKPIRFALKFIKK